MEIEINFNDTYKEPIGLVRVLGMQVSLSKHTCQRLTQSIKHIYRVNYLKDVEQ